MTPTDPNGRYEKQHRGTQAAYEAYFAGMDASMQQKVALTTAHFPVRRRSVDMGSGSGRGTDAASDACSAGMAASMQQKVALTTAHSPVRGRIADMGSGSGRGTYDLACLYGGLELVGVDINPVSVERAAREFQRPNLSYVVGDITEMVFPPESLDGVLNSSVLHHVTSFNDFDVGRVHAPLDKQVAQLKTGGVIIIRDFVIPDGPERVCLDLPASDGSETGAVAELSTAAIFELFAPE